jgi:hypothetical protein
MEYMEEWIVLIRSSSLAFIGMWCLLYSSDWHTLPDKRSNEATI